MCVLHIVEYRKDISVTYFQLGVGFELVKFYSSLKAWVSSNRVASFGTRVFTLHPGMSQGRSKSKISGDKEGQRRSRMVFLQYNSHSPCRMRSSIILLIKSYGLIIVSEKWCDHWLQSSFNTLLCCSVPLEEHQRYTVMPGDSSPYYFTASSPYTVLPDASVYKFFSVA